MSSTQPARTNPTNPYAPDSPHSYFRDLLLASEADRRQDVALDRALTEGGLATSEDASFPPPAHRDAGGAREARGRLEASRPYAVLAKELSELRDLSSTSGAGGEFIPATGPPVHVAEAFATAARAKGVLAGVLPTLPLPAAGVKVQTPRFSTGVSVSTQQDLGVASETDPSSLLASSPVALLAGQTDAARQLFDRSIPNFDIAIAAELGNALSSELDKQLISGSGSAGQLLGFLNVPGTSSVIYTSATPTAQENLAQLGKLVATTASAYGGAVDTVLAHPRRAAFIRSKLGYAPEWPAAIVEVPSLPTNNGAGTNEDVIIALARAESLLFLQPPTFAVMSDVLSGNLEVRCQSRMYAALLANRQPSSIGKLTGTGLTSPTF